MNKNILFIGPDAADFKSIKKSLSRPDRSPMRPFWESGLASALLRLKSESFDAIILDSVLQGSKGFQTLEPIQETAPNTPIALLVKQEDTRTGSVPKRDAHNCLIKGRLDVRPLSDTLQSLIERQVMEAALIAEKKRAKATEEALFVEKERAEETLNSIGDAVLCTDTSGRVTYLNPVAERMTGWRREEAVGHSAPDVFRIIDSDTREPVRDPLLLAVDADKPMALATDRILIRKDRFETAIEESVAPIHDRSGQATGAVVVFHDVSEGRAMALKIFHLAKHDLLTDLPNRFLFGDRLTQAIAMARRHQRQLGVLFLDCDRFKDINDSLGHNTGDLLLQSVAKRLVSAVRSSDTVSRQGGDEFVILLSELEKPDDAGICARKIIKALARPHRIGSHDLLVTASIGFSVYPEDGRNAETLIKNADMALYAAKESGRNTYRAFRSDMRAREAVWQSIEASLMQALERDQFRLHYQPRVALTTGAVVGVEALIRWDHPERGLIPPAEFVPIAEDTGLIVPIGRWVLHEACRQAADWRKAGLGTVPMAVNVSAIEFRTTGLVEEIAGLLADKGLEAQALELELTERVLMQEAGVIDDSLRAIAEAGVRLTLDDFGTGFSNLSYIKRFPISTLKIDASFVKDLSNKEGDRTLVAAIIGLGKTLEKTVIAEGIETEDQLDVLRGLGCDQGQGFYLCRPLPADDFATYLAAVRCSGAPSQNRERSPSHLAAVPT